MNIERAVVPVTIEHVAGADGQFRVKGIANTFGVMRSGRLVYRKAVAKWLESNPKPSVQFMAGHGDIADGFSSIGKVDVLRIQEGGLYFEAFIGTGTRMCDEARALIAQKIIDTVSIGWVAKVAYIDINDPEIDAFAKQKLTEAGKKQALASVDNFELLEISLEEIPDDKNARLAAAIQEAVSKAISDQRSAVSSQPDEDANDELRMGRLESRLSAKLEELHNARTSEIRTLIEAHWKAGEVKLFDAIEAMLADPRSDYARALLDASADAACEHTATEHGTRGAPGGQAKPSAIVNELNERMRKLAGA